MSPHTITLFMWGYQPHFRVHIELLMNSVMKELGVDNAGGKCLLVGVKAPGSDVGHTVCVEPEDGPWPLSLFSNLPAAIDEQIERHELQNIFYGDEPSMRAKPENIRRDSVRRAVMAALNSYNTEASVRSFAAAAVPVDGYYVVPVLQLPESLFERFRPLREPVTDGQFTGMPSLTHAAAKHVLVQAQDELLRPDPGSRLGSRSASAAEIARRAAVDFMHTPGIAIGDPNFYMGSLYERFNLISTLMYEGVEGKGRILLARLESQAVDVALALSEPVPFHNPRWSRKVLQMASSETALLANTESVLGLGNVAKDLDPWISQNVFEVEFHDHHHWSISCGEEVLLVSRNGVPSLPQDKFPKARLLDTFQRLFPEVTPVDVESFAALFEAAVGEQHGSMLVVTRDAADEATRLRSQGTKTVPARLTPELFRRVSNIDGTILVDPTCTCHAVGVILDGAANEHCTPSRGSRYNSGIRYVAGSATPRLAVVVSEDGTVDVIPLLRPRVSRKAIERQIAQLESTTVDKRGAVIDWLDKHRFYLDQAQCERINAAQSRIDGELSERQIRIVHTEFRPDPDCNDEYFNPDDR